MQGVTRDVHDRLNAAYGASARRPESSDSFEAAVAAILGQQGGSAKASLAIERLRDNEVRDPHAVLAMELEELETLLKPAGHAAAKAKRLRSLCRHVVEQRDGCCDDLFSQSRSSLVEELLSINGIGPETADTIALFAARLPAFPIEAGTHRVWKRHGWADMEADYFSLQEQIESGLPADAAAHQELHALLSRVASDFCRTQPKCDGCPLACLLPPGGPIDPQA
ncbi:MAG: endonuclease III domain-containing protein [Pirellulales bacterium]